MKVKLLIGCVVLQLAILGWMAGEREWVRNTGRTVYFRTMPVDPRDVMRGDYVRLNYSLSQVDPEQCRGDLAEEGAAGTLARDTRVYAALREEPGGVVQLADLGTDRPASGLYVRGRTTHPIGSHFGVRYGIEAWFVEQGQGKVLEEPRAGDRFQVPLEMEAALSPGGLAVLKGHRWCPVGIALDVVTNVVGATSNTPAGARLISATVQILNAGSNDLAIVDLPGGGSLSLIPASTWGRSTWRWVSGSKPEVKPQPEHVIVLKPGQIHQMTVNFNEPRWTVRQESGEVKTVADLTPDWNTRFRLVYRPPDQGACAQLPHAALIWHGELQTRAFSTMAGAID